NSTLPLHWKIPVLEEVLEVSLHILRANGIHGVNAVAEALWDANVILHYVVTEPPDKIHTSELSVTKVMIQAHVDRDAEALNHPLGICDVPGDAPLWRYPRSGMA